MSDEFDDLFRPSPQSYSEEELRRIDEALTRTQGNRQHALIILGMDRDGAVGAGRLKDMIRNTPWLRAKWSKMETPPPNVAHPVDIDRPAPLIAPTREATVKAITRQDKLMGEQLDKLFRPEEADLIKAIQTQYTGHMQATLDLTYGGAVHSTAKMLVLQKQLQDRLDEIDADPSRFERTAFTKEGTPYIMKDAHDYRMEVADRLIKVSDLIRKQNTSINEATKTRLMADKLRREMAQADKGPKSVAGWSAPVKMEETK